MSTWALGIKPLTLQTINLRSQCQVPGAHTMLKTLMPTPQPNLWTTYYQAPLDQRFMVNYTLQKYVEYHLCCSAIGRSVMDWARTAVDLSAVHYLMHEFSVPIPSILFYTGYHFGLTHWEILERSVDEQHFRCMRKLRSALSQRSFGIYTLLLSHLIKQTTFSTKLKELGGGNKSYNCQTFCYLKPVV